MCCWYTKIFYLCRPTIFSSLFACLISCDLLIIFYRSDISTIPVEQAVELLKDGLECTWPGIKGSSAREERAVCSSNSNSNNNIIIKNKNSTSVSTQAAGAKEVSSTSTATSTKSNSAANKAKPQLNKIAKQIVHAQGTRVMQKIILSTFQQLLLRVTGSKQDDVAATLLGVLSFHFFICFITF